MTVTLTEEQIQRYSRHILLSEVGGIGQKRILESTVAVVLPHIHAPTEAAATMLATSGVGKLLLVYKNTSANVTCNDIANSFLLKDNDVGKAYADALIAHLIARNPDVQIGIHAQCPKNLPVVDMGSKRRTSASQALVSGSETALAILWSLICHERYDADNHP